MILKRNRLGIAVALAAVLALASCSQDELADGGNMLPDGQYPLEIASVSLNVEGSEQPWTKVGENTDGTGSVWDGNEQISVQIGTGTPGTYTVNSDGSVTAVTPAYWQSTATGQTVTAWYASPETNGIVSLRDQQDGLAYVLRANATANFNSPVTLNFAHQLAKVRVVLSGSQADKVMGVEIKSYTTCTHTQGATISGSDEDWITMQYVSSPGYYEANVVPGQPITQFRINGTVEGTLTQSVTPVAASLHTITLTVKSSIPDDAKEITGSINDNGNYVVSGTRSEAINITGGSPHIYLDDAQISVSSGPAINITGGTPTIHVVGTGNSVTSGNDTGIAVSGGATVTITGNSTADVLTANGGTSGNSSSDTAGAGIGSPVGGTQGGNVIIRNVTVNATGGAISIRGGGAGIGSSSNGTLGDITIENAVINATGGYMSAAIGMGCNHYNDQSPAPSIGAITITNSDVTATAGRGAAAIGFSYSMTIMGSSTYCSGKITITTDNLDTFLSHLSLNQATTTNYTLAQRIGKGQQMSNYPSTFRNTDNTGSWEGVVINGTAYPDGYE